MRVGITIFLAVFLPLAALMVVFFEPVCHALADASIPEDATASVAQGGTDVSAQGEHDYLVEVAMGVRDFSLGNDEANLPQGTDYHNAITSDALSHLLDVRTVFLACEFACALLLVALAFMIMVTRNKKGAGQLIRPLILGGAIPLAAAVVLGLAIAIDFSAFFTWIHGIFFADGTWTFPADSLLIRALPYNFWMACAGVWAGCMVAFCAISIIVGLVLRNREKKKDVQ